MPVISSSTQPKDVIRRPGRDYDFRTRTMYMSGRRADPSASAAPDPQGFLIEIGPPGGSIPPHFHEIKQFQVFIHGSGSLGRNQSLDPIVVHFTDAYTTYGPIHISEEGISYFTLRHERDPGAQYMPESRDKQRGIPGKPGRSISARVPEELLSDGLAHESTALSMDILGPDTDGLYVWVTRAGSDATWVGPDPRAGDGSYWIVLRGSLLHEGEPLPERSLVYVQRDEPAFVARAGPEGAVVVGMQFGTSGGRTPSRGAPD